MLDFKCLAIRRDLLCREQRGNSKNATQGLAVDEYVWGGEDSGLVNHVSSENPSAMNKTSTQYLLAGS
jgi:hypothetical protein